MQIKSIIRSTRSQYFFFSKQLTKLAYYHNCTDEQTVVCYCSLGYRSSQYAAALCKQLEKQTG